MLDMYIESIMVSMSTTGMVMVERRNGSLLFCLLVMMKKVRHINQCADACQDLVMNFTEKRRRRIPIVYFLPSPFIIKQMKLAVSGLSRLKVRFTH